jgi:type IV pilus assembly protein PilW
MKTKVSQQGFSLVELMVSSLLGLIISYAVLEIYLTQSQFYKTSNSQSLILNTENALINLLTPSIRSAGFLGCGTIATATSTLNAGSPDPLGSMNTEPTLIRGYNGSGSSFSFSQTNPANDTNSSHWAPTLPSSLTGQTQQGSDVFIVLGASPETSPIGVTQIDPGSDLFGVQSTANTSIASGQLGAVSDCGKSVIFQITGVGATSITHTSSSGAMHNASSAFPVNFPLGAQFIQLQQTAFFIAQGQGGQSSLMRGILNGSSWTIEPLIPGIEFMKVEYGIGDNGLITQYVSANGVPDWSKVYALRLGFLISGKIGSANIKTMYTVLNTTVTVPADSLLRHTFEMTIQLRNSL